MELLQSAWFPSLTGSTSLLVPKNPSFTQVVIRVMPQETEESPVILKVLATIIGDNGNEMVMGWTLRFPTTMQAEQFIHRCQSFIESLASITTYQQSAANAPSASTNIFLLYTSPYHLRKLVLAGKLGRTHDPRALSLVRLIQYIQAHGTLFIGPEQIAPWKTFIAQSIQTFTTDVDPRFYTQIQGMLAQVLPTYAMLGAKICEGVFFPAQLRYFGEYPNGPLVILDQTDRNRLKIFIALIRMHIKELKIAVKRNRLDQFHYPAIALQEITIPTPDAVMALPIPEWKKKKIIELLAQIPTPRQGEPFLDLTGRFHFEKLPPQLALPDEGGLKCLPFRASNS
ncbi:MAG: hypothetical protein LBJ77_00350 [Holosporales bacterium]|nr:hypothetical protein [Holosporales bacterium]